MTDAVDVLEYPRNGVRERCGFMPRPGAMEIGHPQRRSRFEALARLSGSPSPHFATVIDTLLAAACPGINGGSSALSPIWAEEAMHRSYTMMRLLDARTRHDRSRGGDPVAVGVEHGLAHDIASQLRSLELGPDKAEFPCSNLLRNIVTDLVALFGGAADVDRIILSTHIEQLHLPTYQRRALILATVELVMNGLLHAFPRRASGRIEVSLTLLSATRARLHVKGDGIGFAGKAPNRHCGVAAGLADLLEADLAYYRTSTLTVAEIVFPYGTAPAVR